MEKPFIKLFHTPNSGYFYDVGKNEIIRIPENIYLHLSEVINGSAVLDQSDDEEVLEMIESFKELGYLSSNRPKHIKHPATEMVALYQERCIDKVTLQLTQDCNFRCKYCIYSEEINLKQRSHSHKMMSFDTAKKAIMFYRDHAIDSNMYSVGLYGGEPLMQWNLLREIVLFTERALEGKLLTLSLTTNASLMTEQMATFLEDHNISVTISLDGIKAVNDANRVFLDGRGSYDVVVRKIQMIKENFPNLFEKLRISSVIDPELDVTAFGLYPCELDGIPTSNYSISLEENTEQVTVISRDLYKAMQNDVFLAYLAEIGVYTSRVSPYGLSQIKSVQSNMESIKPTNGIQNIMSSGGQCIPGKSRLFVTVDGRLYPCERVNESESNCIGNLDNGFIVDRAKQMLNIGSITEKKCQNCWAIRNCTLCCKYFDYSSEDAVEEKTKYCDTVQKSVFDKMRGMILLNEIEKYYRIPLQRGGLYE